MPDTSRIRVEEQKKSDSKLAENIGENAAAGRVTQQPKNADRTARNSRMEAH